jgi:phosphate:Na+ symporter
VALPVEAISAATPSGRRSAIAGRAATVVLSVAAPDIGEKTRARILRAQGPSTLWLHIAITIARKKKAGQVPRPYPSQDAFGYKRVVAIVSGYHHSSTGRSYHMVIVRMLFELFGGLALFMYGMQLSSDGIQRAAGDRLQRAVNFMTKNRVMAVLTGAVLTILIQSSSATSVMVVSFVNAGLLSLVQAIGVIMGANIGTTLTGWIIAAAGVKSFNIEALALPVFGLGFFMSLMKKKGSSFVSAGESLMGFAMIFLGLSFIASGIPKPSGEVLAFLRGFSDKGFLAVIVCVLVGTVFTILINASSATLAIVIALASEGVIDFRMAAAITLGANIGTTFDAFLASISANASTNAKRAGWAHILFNVFGTVWVVAIFDPFLRLVDWLTPGPINQATMGAHIAMLHTVFNTANTLVLLPLTNQYAALLERLFKDKPLPEGAPPRLAYIAGPIMDSPELNLLHARKEISDMAGIARNMFERFRKDLREVPADMEAEIEWFKGFETYADGMQEELSRFLLEVTSQNVNSKTQGNIQQMLHVVEDLESITDACMSLAYLLERRSTKRLALDQGEIEGLVPANEAASAFLSFVAEKVNKPIGEEELAVAADFEEKLDSFRSELKKMARKRLKAGADVKTELLFIDMVRHIEKIGDYGYSIAQSLREMR